MQQPGHINAIVEGEHQSIPSSSQLDETLQIKEPFVSTTQPFSRELQSDYDALKVHTQQTATGHRRSNAHDRKSKQNLENSLSNLQSS